MLDHRVGDRVEGVLVLDAVLLDVDYDLTIMGYI